MAAPATQSHKSRGGRRLPNGGYSLENVNTLQLSGGILSVPRPASSGSGRRETGETSSGFASVLHALTLSWRSAMCSRAQVPERAQVDLEYAILAEVAVDGEQRDVAHVVHRRGGVEHRHALEVPRIVDGAVDDRAQRRAAPVARRAT